MENSHSAAAPESCKFFFFLHFYAASLSLCASEHLDRTMLPVTPLSRNMFGSTRLPSQIAAQIGAAVCILNKSHLLSD